MNRILNQVAGSRIGWTGYLAPMVAGRSKVLFSEGKLVDLEIEKQC